MKQIILSLLMALIYSCANTKTLKKEVVTPAKIQIDKTKTIAIAEVKSHFNDNGRNIPFFGTKNYALFAARSFENLFIDEIAKKKDLNIIDRASFNEAFDDHFANREPRASNADYLMFITYEEQSGMEPYSYDREGIKRKTFFALGRVTYKIIERESGKIIASNSFHQKFNEPNTDYLFVNGEQVYGPNSEVVAIKLRKFLSSELVNEFYEQKNEEAFSFKTGADKKFTSVIKMAEQNDQKNAILTLEEILKSCVDKNDISDGHYNLALLYYITGDINKAREASKFVQNGFISKDYNRLSNLLN